MKLELKCARCHQTVAPEGYCPCEQDDLSRVTEMLTEIVMELHEAALLRTNNCIKWAAELETIKRRCTRCAEQD